jgi:hypothetical protein
MILLPFVCALAPAPLPALVQAPDKYAQFKKNFKAAQAVGAHEEMARLVRSNQDEAIRLVSELANAMAAGSSAEIEAEFQALSKTWSEVFKTDFVERLYRYHSELAFDKPRREERYKLEVKYYEKLKALNANASGAKDSAVYEMVGAEFAAFSARFEELGDHYFAAQAAAGVAVSSDESYRGKDADLRRACEWWGKAVANFDKVALNYSYYQSCKQRFEGLVAAGFGPAPAADPNAPAAPTTTPSAPAAPVVAATSFELVDSLEKFVRPLFTADELYQMWPIVSLGAKGSSANFQALGDKGPSVLRTESAKAGVDVDRDGAADKPLPMTGNFTAIDVEFGADKRRWGFLFKTGIQDDRFQGLQTNLLPDDNQMRVYVINAASVVASINGTPVRVLDENMDGEYGSEPKPFYYPGLSEGVAQPDYDCVVVGASKRARPWSKYLEVGGAWYEVKPLAAGAQIEYRATPLETGTLKLDFKGPVQPNFLILKGTGNLEGCYFDVVTENKKPLAVPVGQYELMVGELRQGKKTQTVKCLILPGSDARRYMVSKGAETLVTLGAPFNFEFSTEAAEESLTVKGKSVAVVGSAKERYERFWNCVPRPEVSVRKAGSKKGGKPEKMDIVMDLLERNEDGSFRFVEADTWRPIDTQFAIKKGESVEAQLSEKKHKLLGDISSEFK